MNAPALSTPPMHPSVNVATVAGKEERLLEPREAWGSKLLDQAFHRGTQLCAFFILVLVALIVAELYQQSTLSLQQFGLKFFVRQAWDPVAGDFGALPFIYGTLVSSFLALLLAVPFGIGVAMFLTEM